MRGKSRFKIISIIMIVSILLTLIPIRNIIIKAENKSDPSFGIEGVKVSPNPSILGEDITISGTIKPKDFEVQSIDQELVIILDVSKKEDGSNNGNNPNKIINPLGNFIKDFINKKNNGNNMNLKIGVIAYSSESQILQINNNKLVNSSEFTNWNSWSDFNKVNSSKSTNKNIGDALRQAVYLLNSNESNPSANKTILLVAEGDTDSRRIYNDWNFCLDTSKEAVENTKIVPDNSDKNLEYAKAIGNIIKDKGYNVFTMGFDIDKKDNEKAEKQKNVLKQIHASMTGYTDLNHINCEEKGLFLETRNPNDNGDDIKRIFTKIFDNFSKEYYLNNVSLNFKFDNDITLKSGENFIKLENIKYKIDTSTGNSAIYKADPIPFSFVIKAKKVGEKQNIFQNLNIGYLWKNKNQAQALTSNINITVENNNYPNISATLRGDLDLTANPSDIITVQYDIEPKEILFNNLDFMKKDIEEVIFLVDLTQKLNNGNNAYSLLQNGINNAILDDDKLKNKKFGFVGYSDKDYYIGDDVNLLTQNDSVIIKNPIINELKSPLFKIDNSEGKNDYRILYQGGKISISDNNNRNIDNALIKTIEVFDKFGDDNKGKAIVLVTTDSVLYTDEVVNKIKNKGYKIISLDISANKITNIQEFYKKLGGIVNDDYIIGKFSDGQNYNEADNDMAKVGERLKSGVVDKDKAIIPKLTFDLNNNFEYVKDSNDNISLVSNKDNKLEFALNKPIEYRYSGEMVDGKYKFIADEQTISFKVKVKDSKLSNLTFGSNTKYLSNYMSYKNFSKEEVKVALTTPEVTLIQKVSNISHGLYNGIANNKVEIKEWSNR